MRFGTIYKLNEMKKKIIDFLTHRFVLITVVAFITAQLDLISLTVGSKTFAAGWVLAFVFFFGGIAYSIYKGFKN